MDALLDLRRIANVGAAVRVSITDFVLKAAAEAFLDLPGAIATRDGIDIALAIATRSGVVTPVLRAVESMSLSEVASAREDLVYRARAGRVSAGERECGQFAIANTGLLGPQRPMLIAGPARPRMLSVGAASPRALIVDGRPTVATVMSAALATDHRVFDGALAAQWLEAFVGRLENPLTLI